MTSGNATPVATSAAANGENPAITKSARDAFYDLRRGIVHRDQFTAEVAAVLTPEAVAAAAKTLKAIGEIRTFTFVTILRSKGGIEASNYEVTGTNGTIHYAFGLDTSDKTKIAIFAFE